MKNRKKSAINIALIRLEHVPFVVTNDRRMAVWSDLKEILLWCPSPHCCMVLDILKVILGYPKFEMVMHPCSQLEQLMFLKQFMFVSPGTLLVDVESLRDEAKLGLLYNLVKEKHTSPSNQTVFDCTKMLKTFSEKYTNTSFKIPLSSASAKRLLPAVRRRFSSSVWKNKASKDSLCNEKVLSKSHDINETENAEMSNGDDKVTRLAASSVQTGIDGNGSKTLVPLVLLSKLYPGCEDFLDEVVRLYVLGLCGQENLQSVCQSTTEEGIQLTRFLASQNGYERCWMCLTTCSIMMSWSDFWIGLDNMYKGQIRVLSNDVCVVILNFQQTEERKNEKVSDSKQTTTSKRHVMSTQPSPSLSAISDITENLQRQKVKGPLSILSKDCQSIHLQGKDDFRQKREVVDKTRSVDTDTLPYKAESKTEPSSTETEMMSGDSNRKHTGYKDTVEQLDIETSNKSAKIKEKQSGIKSKMKLSGANMEKTSKRRDNKKDNLQKDDKMVLESDLKIKSKKIKSKKGKVKDKAATELDPVSDGIKSRLRSRIQEKNTITTHQKRIRGKKGANNSAVESALSSVSKSGLCDSTKSYSKSSKEIESVPSSCKAIADDLSSKEFPMMEGIHVSVNTKEKEMIRSESVPGEIDRDFPLHVKQIQGRKTVESLQSIRNRREILKIQTAQIQDDITQQKSIRSKKDENNSAVVGALSSVSKSGSGDSNKSDSKSSEVIESGPSSCETFAKLNISGSRSGQTIGLKAELPMAEVTSYDLASRDFSLMGGIHVSITPKKENEMHPNSVPGEIDRDFPLHAKQMQGRKTVESLQSIRNRREFLKIPAAQLQDDIPVYLKCPEVNASYHSTADQAAQKNINRGKRDNKTNPQDRDDVEKDNNLEYICLTSNKIEFTEPMQKIPESGKLQQSNRSPSKSVRNVEDAFKKKRSEAFIYRLRTEPVSVVLEGKPIQNETAIKAAKCGQSQALGLKNSFNPLVKPGKLPLTSNRNRFLHAGTESNLETEAVNSFSSLSGNQAEQQLAAEGTSVKTFRRTLDLDSSDFLNERITKWKNEVENSLNLPSHGHGRLIKSADMVRRRQICTCRPRSSMYNSEYAQTDGRGPSFKNALSALYSRDRASSHKYNKQIHIPSCENLAFEGPISEKADFECSNINSSSSTSIASEDSAGMTRKGISQIKLDPQSEVQNFGSSSSVTPDIYDEFARIKKPKSLRPEIVKIKPKPPTVPIPTTLCQPIARKQIQPSLKSSKKTNYHTVGYMSSVETTQQSKDDSASYSKQDLPQKIRYTDSAASQNLPYYSKAQLINSPSKEETRTSDNSLTSDQVVITEETISDVNQPLEDGNEMAYFASLNSDKDSLFGENTNSHPPGMNPLAPINQIERLEGDTFERAEKTKESQVIENDLTHNCSESDVSNFCNFMVSPGKIEALEYVQGIQTLFGPVSSGSSTKKEFNPLKTKQDTRKCQSAVTIAEKDKITAGQSMEKQRAKSSLQYEDKRLLYQRPTQENTLSKVNTQLYYKVPDDERFYPVSENMLIPRYAQFFVQTTSNESGECGNNEELLFFNGFKSEQNYSQTNEHGTEGMEMRNEVNSRNNLNAVKNMSDDEKLSDTTFDSIIKASEDFMDKSKLMKHIISETRQAIERNEVEEVNENPVDPQREFGITDYVEEQTAKTVPSRSVEEDYPKVIIPSFGRTIENQNTSQKKSFKEIIEEKRLEKRKVEEILSRKKYWNSAHEKAANNQLSSDNKNHTQMRANEANKGIIKIEQKDSKNKSQCLKCAANVDAQNIKQPGFERQINSKFVVATQQKPRTRLGKGRSTMTSADAGRRARKGSCTLNARSQTDIGKQKQYRTNAGNGSKDKYLQASKPPTIYCKYDNSKMPKPEKADDCTSKILTALRRLSIEKSTKVAEEKKPSKQDVRQSKLRSCVAKQASRAKSAKTTHPAQSVSKESNGASLKYANQSNDVKDKDKTEKDVKQVCIGQEKQFSKIPVVIGVRKESNDRECRKIHKKFDEDKDDNYDDNLQDHEVEQSSIPESVSCEGPEFDSETNEEKVKDNETFITLFNTRELSMYNAQSDDKMSTEDSNASACQMNNEKYLGIPYFQDANSNMNNAEFKLPTVNLESRNNLSVLEEQTQEMENMTNEQLYNLDFFPRKSFGEHYIIPPVQIPTASTVTVRNKEFQNMEASNHPAFPTLNEDLDGTDKQSLFASFFPGTDDMFFDDRVVFPEMDFVRQTKGSMEKSDNNGLDYNWSCMAFNQTTANQEDDFYIAESGIEPGNLITVTSESEEKGHDAQNEERLKYVACNIPEVIPNHNDNGINLFDNINIVPYNNESNTDNGMGEKMKHYKLVYNIQKAYNTEQDHPDQPLTDDTYENLVNVYFCQPVKAESVMHPTDDETNSNEDSTKITKETDKQSTDSKLEDMGACHSVENEKVNFDEQSQPIETSYTEGSGLNDNSDDAVFLDETECGQEVCIGDVEASDREIHDLENGLSELQNEKVLDDIVETNNKSSEMFCDKKVTKEREEEILQKADSILKRNNEVDKRPKGHSGKKGLNSSKNKEDMARANKNPTGQDRKQKLKQKPEKRNVTHCQNTPKNPNKLSVHEKGNPTQKEKEAHFKAMTEQNGKYIASLSKDEYNTKTTTNYKTVTDSSSYESLPEFDHTFSIKRSCFNKSESSNVGKQRELVSEENTDRDTNLRCNDDNNGDDEIEADDENDDDDDELEVDDENDNDYNPEEDLKETKESSDDSDSNDDTSDRKAKSTKIVKCRKNVSKTEYVDSTPKKNGGVCLKKVRQSFQKKYDIKNSSAIHEWKKKNVKKEGKESGRKNSTKRQTEVRDKSIVREFCLKNSQKNNETLTKLEMDTDIYLEKVIESHEREKGTKKKSCTSQTTSSDCNSEGKEGSDITELKTSKSIDMIKATTKNDEIIHPNSAKGQKIRKKKRGKKTVNGISPDGEEDSEDEKRKQVEESAAAEGFIKTQKRYYEILRKSIAGIEAEDIEASDEHTRVEDPAVDKLSAVIEAVPVHGERVITKAISDAEKALEGTGSLENILSDDEGTMIEDLVNQCRYQMIEDEDHLQLGGVAHFKEFALPFVYINGYKYTPLKDALTLFSPDCCISSCTIPKSVLQKHKSIVRTFSTWEQVYKLELIKMKKGPAIMTGDILIKLDTLLVLLPELIQKIVQLHIGTKLKRSKKCDISAYKTLKSKFL